MDDNKTAEEILKESDQILRDLMERMDYEASKNK